MIQLIEIVRNESHEQFLVRLLRLAETDYIQNEAWLLLKIKQLIKMRLD